ncbi:hypothetical protein GCM10025866_36560 [Naasia aerilata]|uniref:Proline--tRNA ligase n=1 Tax=Naasia aerilata TaxID=1162966 RepID=A0ABM8GHB3_9MICO|nr:hypothetical protein GCM10025866_36560 [Naasia aerilata]
MPTRLSQLFVRTLREDPADAEVTSHRLLVRAGYIRRQAPGIFAWLPLGLRVRSKVERVIREEMDSVGAQEVLFPGLLPREPYEATGRWEEYGDGIFRLKDRKGADYLLAPTHEEVFTLLVKDLYSSYKDLPLTIYQIQDKYRDEARPRAGLLRGREFSMKDAYSFDWSDEGLDASYSAQRAAYERIFRRLGLEYVIVAADAGAMGGSKSEEFLHPTPIGEDTFVRSAGGYTANVEAFTTLAPDALPIDGRPDARIFDSPNTPTIATLVDLANAEQPRDDRLWTAADTLKNVVLALTHLDGTRELVVAGLPGDRDVDLKRAEVAFQPAEVEAATEADFDRHPLLVKGYIGPWSPIGQVLGLDSATNIRYLVDPRVVDGTPWITGANEDQKHVLGLVAGRDFVADGTAEVAEVREGIRRRTARALSRSTAAPRSATCSSWAASTPRPSACRCSTPTGSSSPSPWAPTASASRATSPSSRRPTRTSAASSGPGRSLRSTCTSSPRARTRPCTRPPRRLPRSSRAPVSRCSTTTARRCRRA